MDTNEDREQYVQDLLASLRDQIDEENDKEREQSGPDNETTEEAAEESGSNMPTGLSTPVDVVSSNQPKKKKKKKKKSKTANLPEAGSEIPDNYQEKYNEDVMDNPYDPSLPLSQRVEYAIWKYKKNHKFTEGKRALFDNYLRFGGIETGPNAFMGRATGGDQDADGEPDWDAAKMSTAIVPEEDEELEVNFTEVAQVYLGNTFVRESMFIGQQDFIDAPLLVDAFLRYLQIRNVCPEYADDIAHARQVVAQAKIELPLCKKIMSNLPGDFSRACTVLFGGDMQSAWAFEAASWMGSTNKTKNMFDKFMMDTFGDAKEQKEAMAMVSPIVKDPDQRKTVDQRENLFVKLKEIEQLDADAPDSTLAKVTLVNYEDENDTLDILLEHSTTKHMLAGMVMTVTVCQLDNGFWYLDRANCVMPSFYMYDDCMDPDCFCYS
ncbi:hypothetical protein K492DRAFT_140101 [Lichtheimia hyalospora FSU 10163]|nr:hypothetical protein K492DRAFT_140101 [Lichtheimia hyalospora FSU 10163]